MERRKLSWWRGKARLVFRIGLAVGFVVQSLLFFLMYLEYPAMVQLDITQPNMVDFPAFTVCNLNEVRISPYCEKYPDNCGSIDTNPELCNSYPEYCHLMRNTTRMMPFHRVEKYNLTRYESQAFGHQIEDLMVSCVVSIDDNETPCKKPAKLISSLSHSNRRPFNCFMFYSLSGRPHDKPERVPVSTVIRMELNPQVNEYHPEHLSRGAQISVHSPYHVPSAMSEGYLLNLGTIYRLYLRLTRMDFLPAPYKSRCRDYMQEWKAAGGEGPITQKMCKEKCKLDKSMEEYGCADSRINYPHNFSICQGDNLHFHQRWSKICSDSCSIPCEFSRFDVDSQVANSEGHRNSCTTYKDLTCATLVQIFLENMEITTFDYNPRFEAVGILSWIGGYVGLWLGISLLHVYDFLETRTFRWLAYLRHKRGAAKKRGRRKRPSFEPPSSYRGAIYIDKANHRF